MTRERWIIVVLILIGTGLGLTTRSVWVNLHDSRDVARVRADRAEDRLRRICADVDLKVQLAQAWTTAAARGDDGKLMLVTLEGVRAICTTAEAP